MNDDTLQMELPDPLTEEGREWYRAQFVGKYRANWEFLRVASGSCYVGAVRALSDIMQAWRRGLDSGISRADASVVLGLNYSHFVSGPLLSAVLMPTFAIESFVRLSAEVNLVGSHASSPDGWRLALSGFDGMPFLSRLQTLIEMAGADKLPPETRDRLRSLIEFRNGTVHDTPYLHDDEGGLIYVKHGKLKALDETKLYGGRFPLLSDVNFPLDLEHAREAIVLHDEFVNHIFETAPGEFSTAFERRLSALHGSGRLIRRTVPDSLWDEAAQLNAAWREEVLEWEALIPLAEKTEALTSLARRQQVTLVDDGQ